ncbi:transcription termination factor 4, mitochondrial isoform X1 [Ascaphus truei]|uniref:transcription termination factor 4, mitochondrial isoform X1 n=2 Tax=Ascaphus truei TaxID=8439 RepID=UPI003F59DCCE
MVSLWLRHVLYLPGSVLCLRHLSSLPGVTQGLLDLGFSEEQAGRILSMKPRGGDPQHRLSSARELLLIGLNPQTTLRMLEGSPELLRVTSMDLRNRAENLRSLGLREGSLQRTVCRCPSLLSLPRSRILSAVQCLKHRCRFSSQQVADLVRSSPEALTQDPGYLEEAFQYVYFRMGGNHEEIITSGLFLTPLHEVRVRHEFLERLGRFQPPDKKGASPPSNPKLKHVLVLSEQDFLSRLAVSSHEELQTFRKMIAREKRDARREMEDEGDQTSTDSEDEGDQVSTDSEDDGDQTSTDREDEGEDSDTGDEGDRWGEKHKTDIQDSQPETREDRT